MSKDWIEKLKKHLPPSVGRAVNGAEQTLDKVALHIHFSHWHPISTMPFNRDLELRAVVSGEIKSLKFPCRQTNAGEWINADLACRCRFNRLNGAFGSTVNFRILTVQPYKSR